LNVFHSGDDILEKQKITVSTNTMSSRDMIEAYMYAWMVQSFHSSGFSQFQARLANKYGISYRQFYDKFYEKIQTSPSLNTFFFGFKREVEKTFNKDNNSDINFPQQPDSYGLGFWKNNFKNIQDLGNCILLEFNIPFEKTNYKNLNKILYDSISNRKKDNISSIITELLI
jgi:hypothetical protein